MARIDLRKALDGKWEDGTRPKDLFAAHVAQEPSKHVDAIVDALRSAPRKVQAGRAELASLVSEHTPDALYRHVDLFLSNLKAKEPVLRWEAVCTLGNLAAVDRDGKTREAVGTLIEHLRDKSIVLQGHAVRALAKIADAHVELAPRIFKALVAARDSFPGNRVGYIVEAMGSLAKHPDLRAGIREFLEPLAESDISSVASKARKALKTFKTLK